jgi:hypothetical protein
VSIAKSPSRPGNYDTPLERDGYVSAHTHRPSNTMRMPAPMPSQPATRSKSGSRITATATPPPSSRLTSRGNSYIPARNEPLPASRVGRSRADWDDDADSIAPSDSVSCIGSRRSGRSYR